MTVALGEGFGFRTRIYIFVGMIPWMHGVLSCISPLGIWKNQIFLSFRRGLVLSFICSAEWRLKFPIPGEFYPFIP